MGGARVASGGGSLKLLVGEAESENERRRRGKLTSTRPSLGLRAGSATSGANAERMHAMTEELNNMKESVGGLETERDFYFAKVHSFRLLLSTSSFAIRRRR